MLALWLCNADSAKTVQPATFAYTLLGFKLFVAYTVLLNDRGNINLYSFRFLFAIKAMG